MPVTRKELAFSKRYLKELNLMLKRGCNQDDHTEVVEILQDGGVIPAKYRDHTMSPTSKSVWQGCRELHINPDWLLIYETNETTIRLVATGTHSDLY